jgi:hypothetical protein
MPPAAAATRVEDIIDRAKADYLAVSRGAHLYATTEDHARAEQAAWERLEAAIAELGASRN